jgi:hypothetical protein
MFLKQIKKAKLLAIVSLIIIVILSLLITFSIFKSNRTVGYIKDNKIYYKDQIYVESYEVVDFKVSKCLGMIEWTESGNRTKIYSIKNHPGYIYLSMTTDYRIYRLIN